MALAIEIYQHRDNSIDIDWKDENGGNIDMTSYSLSGSIDWDGGTLDIDSMLTYTTQDEGMMNLAITSANATLLPDGAAANITVIATLSSQPYYLLDNYPLFVESFA